LECSFCGNEVKPTIHRREGSPPYEVGYYILLTGNLHQRIIKDPSDESRDLEFYHVTDPQWIITCAECFRKKEVQDKLEEYFTYLPEETDTEDETGQKLVEK
jgi:hypothetical protein